MGEEEFISLIKLKIIGVCKMNHFDTLNNYIRECIQFGKLKEDERIFGESYINDNDIILKRK